MEFKINDLKRTVADGVIYEIHWTATKTDGDFVASVYNTQAVEVGDTVIPFANLTEETVANWVKEKLDLESLEAALDAQIAEQKAPTKASGLPWITE